MQSAAFCAARGRAGPSGAGRRQGTSRQVQRPAVQCDASLAPPAGFCRQTTIFRLRQTTLLVALASESVSFRGAERGEERRKEAESDERRRRQAKRLTDAARRRGATSRDSGRELEADTLPLFCPYFLTSEEAMMPRLPEKQYISNVAFSVQ